MSKNAHLQSLKQSIKSLMFNVKTLATADDKVSKKQLFNPRPVQFHSSFSGLGDERNATLLHIMSSGKCADVCNGAKARISAAVIWMPATQKDATKCELKVNNRQCA